MDLGWQSMRSRATVPTAACCRKRPRGHHHCAGVALLSVRGSGRSARTHGHQERLGHSAWGALLFHCAFHCTIPTRLRCTTTPTNYQALSVPLMRAPHAVHLACCRRSPLRRRHHPTVRAVFFNPCFFFSCALQGMRLCRRCRLLACLGRSGLFLMRRMLLHTLFCFLLPVLFDM